MHNYIWPFKIAAKIVLARLPVPYKFWKNLGLFQHGKMDTSAYALKVFRLHVEKAFPSGLPERFSFLELGPGDSIASAIVARAHGAGAITLCDVGNYADKDIKLYQSIARELRAQGLPAPDLDAAKDFGDIIAACNAVYLTGGLKSLQQIPSASIDFICSQSVLEHVRKHEFDATMRELARIVKPAGRITHSIDLKDHLAYSLNNLRFSEKIWENDFFANSGFYTNRLRPSEILARISASDSDIILSESASWPAIPLERSKMTEPFRSMSDEDLQIRHMHVVLKAHAGEKTQKAA